MAIDASAYRTERSSMIFFYSLARRIAPKELCMGDKTPNKPKKKKKPVVKSTGPTTERQESPMQKHKK